MQTEMSYLLEILEETNSMETLTVGKLIELINKASERAEEDEFKRDNSFSPDF